MRILMINSVCGIGSTGRICTDLACDFERRGHEVKIAYGRDAKVPEQYKKYAVRIGTDFDVKLHGVKSKLFDAHGLGSKKSTRHFLKWASEYNPDFLWLHNIHGYYINYVELFAWIKSRPQMKIKWTLHDCWAFTGHCSYFTMAKCEKWKHQCENCPQPKKYPGRLFIDRSRQNYELKKRCFTGIEKMSIVTPSKWLANLVKLSFLSEYPVDVYYNTVDASVFKATENMFRKEKGLERKKIVLGVASPWDERKGLDDFIQLRKLLDETFEIVLVGLSQEQIDNLPSGILGIQRTNNVTELVEIYSASDVFINPTYEDNYPTTNIEALACGTPVITYRTGGSPESVPDENVFECGDVSGIARRIKHLVR